MQIYADLNAAFLTGKTKSLAFRKEQLLRLAYMIHDNVDRLVEVLERDLGRPKQECLLYVPSSFFSFIAVIKDNVLYFLVT